MFNGCLRGCNSSLEVLVGRLLYHVLDLFSKVTIIHSPSTGIWSVCGVVDGGVLVVSSGGVCKFRIE